jgi:hypothetical protein
VIEPSQRLDHLAAEHVHSLPWPVRWLLRGIGGTSQRGSALASYLLFERSYTRALMDLGYRDAMKRREELQRFLRIEKGFFIAGRGRRPAARAARASAWWCRAPARRSRALRRAS